MKSYTNLEQSKKLAEILPTESADMFYTTNCDWEGKIISLLDVPLYIGSDSFVDTETGEIYAWSLAALLDVLPNGTDVVKEETDTENEKYMCTVGIKDDIISTFANTPVDACVAMIEKLHELNLL